MAVNSFNAQNPPVTTKGDLFTFSTIPTRLGVGANDTVLTADSTAATGLKWAAVSSGGMTLLSTTTFNNTQLTYTLGSISGSYKHLLLTGTGLQSAGTGANLSISIRVNSDTGSNYWWAWVANDVGSVTANGTPATTSIQTGYPLARDGDTSVRFGNWQCMITDYASSTLYKGFQFCGGAVPNNSVSTYVGNGGWNSTAAITSITFFSGNNFKAGTVKLWGIN